MRKRLLIVGCGDVGSRLVKQLHLRYRIVALIRDRTQAPVLRALGAVPLVADLDDPRTIKRLVGLAQIVVYLAPPPSQGVKDSRTAHVIATLGQYQRALPLLERSLPQRLIYISTSGVYGNCAGEQVDETRTTQAQTARAQRRVDAEAQWREWGRLTGVTVSILRVPGIYAADRLPLERLKRGLPAIRDEEDGFVNHVHADDLARMIAVALTRAQPGRIYHAVDDKPQKMGEYFDWVAKCYGLPLPPRVSRAEAQQRLSAVMLSFMGESRRLTNRRIKQEWGFRLRYPTVFDGIVPTQA